MPRLGQLVTVMLLISGALGLVVGPLAVRYGVGGLLALGMAAIAVNLLGTAAAPSCTVLLLIGGYGALALPFVAVTAVVLVLITGPTDRIE